MNSETTYQLVLPVEYREMVLKGLHDDAGHQGRDRTSSHIAVYAHTAILC
jgi:hypothetical protein